MKLTETEIQLLFTFTEKKYVRFYDLQVELVDHLAVSVEELMEQDASLTFESALQKVYSSFGIFGFAKVVQEKEHAVRKNAERLFWTEIKKFFRWPEITFVAFIAVMAWQLTINVSLDILFPILFCTWIGSSVYLIVLNKRTLKESKRKLLMLQFVPVINSGYVFPIEVILFSGIYNAPLFCFLVIFGVLIKVGAYRVFNRMRNEARISYPQAFAG